jgi:hypothetical protein
MSDTLRRPQRRRLDAACPYPPNLLGADEAAHLQHLKVLYHRRQRHRQRLREFADRGRSAAQPLDDDPSIGIGQRVKDAIHRLTLGASVKHLLNYSGPQQPQRGLVGKVLSDMAPASTTSRAGPCASCRTWVGDNPNAATNLRFRIAYENRPPSYQRSTSHVTRPRPQLRHLTRRLRHR